MSGKHYSTQEKAALTMLHLDGLRAPAIARELSRPVSGILAQLRELGLVDDRIARYAEIDDERGMTAEQHRTFCGFVRERAPDYSPGEIAAQWQEEYVEGLDYPVASYDKVLYWMGKLKVGVIDGREQIAKAYPDAKKHRNERIRRKADERSAQSDAAFRKELEAAAKAFLRQFPTHQQRDCSHCDAQYPLTKDFFRGKVEEGKPPQFSLRCRLCDRRRVRWVFGLRTAGKSKEEIRAILKGLYREMWAERALKRRDRAYAAHQAEIKRLKRPNTRECVCCRTVWLLRLDAFKFDAVRDAYSALCNFCDAEFHRRISNAVADGLDPEPIRRERRAAYERAHDELALLLHAEWKKAAGEEIAKRKRIGTRACPDCCVDYPRTEKYFRTDKRGSLQYFCRWCRAKYERNEKRARKDRRAVAEIRAWYKKMIARARDWERQERNEELRREAEKIITKKPDTPVRHCPSCRSSFPFTKKFWRINMRWTFIKGSVVLDARDCACCLRDKAALAWKSRARVSGLMEVTMGPGFYFSVLGGCVN